MGRRAAFLAACLLVLSVSLCGGQDSSVFVIPERTPEPAFTLPDLNGRPVSSKHLAGKVSDVSRKTLEAYDFLETNPNNRPYRYAKRSYVIIDKAGIVRYKKILEKPGDLVPDDEPLKELDRLNEPDKPK